LNKKFSATLKNWDGNLEEFNTILLPLLDEYLHLYYKEDFKFNTLKETNRIRREVDLSKRELNRKLTKTE
jgi:hypothetical protein